MPKMPGRPTGRLLHAEAFEAIRDCRGLTKRFVAASASYSPQFLADLLAHRSGASPEASDLIAAALDVPTAAIFPELAGWIGPLPDRKAARARRRKPEATS